MHMLYLAGIGNSGPDHWQAIWHAQRDDGTWVEHANWEIVSRDAWVEEMHQALERVGGPVTVIAHSLGCLLAAEYLAQHGSSIIAGALLVAVPDVTGPAFPRDATGFRPALERGFAVPNILVASTNDDYCSLEHARRVAARWGSDFRVLQDGGHLNAKSNLGAWPRGVGFLEELVSSLRANSRAVRGDP